MLLINRMPNLQSDFIYINLIRVIVITDKLSKERRSWNMSRIKNKDTEPEMKVRRVLHKMGIGYRLHRKDLPGKPDIVLKKYNTVIFVHGCYWHQHPGCKNATMPKTNVAFWKNKFEKNKMNDEKKAVMLIEMGWHVEVIWECEVNDPDKLKSKLTKLFL